MLLIGFGTATAQVEVDGGWFLTDDEIVVIQNDLARLDPLELLLGLRVEEVAALNGLNDALEMQLGAERAWRALAGGLIDDYRSAYNVSWIERGLWLGGGYALRALTEDVTVRVP